MLPPPLNCDCSAVGEPSGKPALALALVAAAIDVLVSHASVEADAVGPAAGRSSLAGRVQAPRLSLIRPKPSSEVRERRPERDARPEVEREDEEEAKDNEEVESRGEWAVGSSKSATSPTAELTIRIRPTFFSKTTKRLSCGLSTVVVEIIDVGRWRMLWRDPRPRPAVACCDEGRRAPVPSERLRERLSWRL